MSLAEFMNLHTVQVETYEGRTPTGESYADPVDVSCFLDDGLVRTGESGAVEMVSKSRFYTALSNVDVCKVQSRVTANGETALITSAKRRDGGGLLDEVAHLEVAYE